MSLISIGTLDAEKAFAHVESLRTMIARLCRMGLAVMVAVPGCYDGERIMPDHQTVQDRELLRRWVQTWRRAALELEEIRVVGHRYLLVMAPGYRTLVPFIFTAYDTYGASGAG